MLNNSSGFVKLALSIILFPTFFQEAFIRFAWGAEDPVWMMISKRLFLLTPVLAIILGCWLTMASVFTIAIRQNRQDFVRELLITWWDLGKSIYAFWGGILKFVFTFFVTLLGVTKIALLSAWSLVQEIIILPFRLLGHAGRNIVRSPVPWIALVLTICWCLMEAMIFTYVTAPLVVDTFSNITGDQLSDSFVRIPLFIFMLFIVLGSYAILATFVDSVKQKSIASILGIGAVETVVLFVEVVFLYREFVDSLVPWFAQYSENFELGILSTLTISCFMWFGIRSLSWFLFAAHGTPTIMAVIHGKGFKTSGQANTQKLRYVSVSSDFMSQIKKEANWIHNNGDELLASFILPPLQVVAAAINFCTLLVSTHHLFELPLKNIEAISNPEFLVNKASR